MCVYMCVCICVCVHYSATLTALTVSDELGYKWIIILNETRHTIKPSTSYHI